MYVTRVVNDIILFYSTNSTMNYLGQRSLIPARRITMGFHRAATLYTKTTARLPSRHISTSSLRNMSHTPDTYQKDDTISEPSSLKTNVVGGQPEDDPRTQRPFESPTGAHMASFTIASMLQRIIISCHHLKPFISHVEFISVMMYT